MPRPEPCWRSAPRGRETASALRYRLVTDHLGSPRLVIDTSRGAAAQRMDYDAAAKGAAGVLAGAMCGNPIVGGGVAGGVVAFLNGQAPKQVGMSIALGVGMGWAFNELGGLQPSTLATADDINAIVAALGGMSADIAVSIGPDAVVVISPGDSSDGH